MLKRSLSVIAVLCISSILIGTAEASHSNSNSGKLNNITCGLYDLKSAEEMEERLTGVFGPDMTLAFAMRHSHCITVDKTNGDIDRGTFFMKVVRYKKHPSILISIIFKALAQSDDPEAREALVYLLTGIRTLGTSTFLHDNGLADGKLAEEFSFLYNSDSIDFQHWDIFSEIQLILKDKLYKDKRRAMIKTVRYLCVLIKKFEIHEVDDLKNTRCKAD